MKRIMMAMTLIAAFGAAPFGPMANTAFASKSNKDIEATKKREDQRAKDAALKEKRANEKAAKAAKKGK